MANDPVVTKLIDEAQAVANDVQKAQCIIDALHYAAHHNSLACCKATHKETGEKVWIACLVDAEAGDVLPLARMLIGPEQIKQYEPEYTNKDNPSVLPDEPPAKI
jgi:hypothetical protein